MRKKPKIQVTKVEGAKHLLRITYADGCTSVLELDEKPVKFEVQEKPVV
jgi:hypothetical protein